jgi:hypothetical protein
MNEHDTINGIIMVVCLSAIYYHWIVYELKAALASGFVEVQAKIDATKALLQPAGQFCAAERTLRKASAYMEEARGYAVGKTLADVFAARQSVYFARVNALRAEDTYLLLAAKA